MTDAPENQPVAAPVSWMRRLAPHAITAALAIMASLGIQAVLPKTAVVPAPAPTVPIATVAPAPTRLPTQLPVATTVVPISGVARQELLDLRAEDDRLWAAIYLSRAISQIADAESALRINDFDRAGQMIIASDDSLALAYGRTAKELRDPIVQLRREAGGLHADLYLRPENMDARLASLRQTLLALIAEDR
jgi:hypothetical protein